jgi:mono/diheme cytochrome c family protein
MRITYITKIAVVVGGMMVFTVFFAFSSAAQTETKYTDAVTYYKEAKCVVCHGQKAEKKFDVNLKEEDQIAAILKGKKAEKPPNMPAYESKGLTADQAKALLDYMKSLKQ